MLTFWPVILSKRFVPVSLVVMRHSREKRSIFRCSCPIQLNCYMKRAVQLQEQIQGNSGKALRSSFYLTRFGKDGRVKFAIRSAHSRRQASGSRAYGPVYGSAVMLTELLLGITIIAILVSMLIVPSMDAKGVAPLRQ